MRGLRHNARDFDELVENASELAEVAEADLSLSARGVTHHFTLILSGYSRSRRTFENPHRPHPFPARLGCGRWPGRGSAALRGLSAAGPAAPARARGEVAVHSSWSCLAGSRFPADPTGDVRAESRHGVPVLPRRLPDCPRGRPGARLRWRLRPGHPHERAPTARPAGSAAPGEPLVMMDTAITHRWPETHRRADRYGTGQPATLGTRATTGQHCDLREIDHG